ncbi:hypothetical protein [Streptomyces triticiradicis]|uniref:Uncharacterized protein n=1 Tax=Streptomyces triticiradicis TaxID=2651189 RepID=A0A7J5D474_9ACTN|nr:hypothetical protein [Streptomyces triticiradicis]KAB1978630.1 hypothetical protein F8144_38880 [Streptomyces triticiradicis]
MAKMTYLVHIHLMPRGPGTSLPPHSASVIAGSTTHSGVVHVVVHPLARPHPVVGLYIRETTLDQAERSALQVWQHAVTAEPWLDHWDVICADAPLIPFF